MINYSKAKSNNPYTHDREFRNGNGQTGPVQFDLGSGFVPYKLVEDPSIDVPANYKLRRTRDDYGVQDESIRSAKGDVTWNVPAKPDFSGIVKGGVKFLHRSRVVDLTSVRLVPVGNWTLADTGAQLPSVGVYNNQFQSGFLPNRTAIDDFIAANPALVTHDQAAEITNSEEDDYQIQEYIYAAYLMSKVDIKKLTLLGGVRWERTDANIRAVREETRNGVFTAVPVSGPTSYDKFFPNLQAVYHFTDELLLRAAITQTIGRPAYEDTRPLTLLDFGGDPLSVDPNYPNTGSVKIGNPKLKPYFSRNYDLSLEYYGKKNGTVISLAAFRKDIADPIYQFTETQTNVNYLGYGFYNLTFTSQLNGTSGRISGLEFSIYQPFTFLPSPFDGLGVNLNFTKISSNEVIPTRPGEDIPFSRQPSDIRNFTLFYEKGKFAGRVSYSYTGEQIYSLGSNLLNDRYETARGEYDAQVSYRITPHYAVTLAVRNLTREPEQASYGIKSLVQHSRLLDRDWRLSLDFNF
jgi:TonB-dependent receptor